MPKNFQILKHNGTATRKQIIQKAEQLFTKYGYTSVSMSDIANLVKITKAALYYHFTSKQELYFEILEEAFNDFSQLLKKTISSNDSLEERLHSMIITYINFCLKKRDLAKLMMQKLSKKDKDIVSFLEKLKVKISKLIEPLVKEALKHQGMHKENSQLVTYILIGVLNTFITSEILGSKNKWSPEQIADQMMALVFAKK